MALDFTVIGHRLKKARMDKKMTQEDLAEQIDVSVAFLSRIERGLSHINLKRLSQNGTAIYKYEFFYDKEFGEQQKEYYEGKYPGIEIVKFYDIK